MIRPLLVVAAATAAHAQTPAFTYEFQIAQPVLQPGQTTTVTVLVSFTPDINEPISTPAGPLLVFGASRGGFDLHADAGSWTLGAPPWGSFLAPYMGPSQGTVAGSNVEGVAWGGLFGPILCTTCLTNPAALWRATFTAPQEPGPIQLAAIPVGDHAVWAWDGIKLPTIEVFSQQTTGGAAVITVIPAPAAWPIAALAAIGARRPRRTR